MKGIIIVKDPSNVKFIKESFQDWLVLTSSTTEKEIEFFLHPSK